MTPIDRIAIDTARSYRTARWWLTFLPGLAPGLLPIVERRHRLAAVASIAQALLQPAGDEHVTTIQPTTRWIDKGCYR